MTKEDAKKFLYSIAEDLGFTGVEDYTCKDGEKMRDAIKILEQEPILDKIEEEIKDTLYVDSLIFTELIDFRKGSKSADDVIEEFNRITRMEVLRIIDKYRAESEVRNE